MPVAVFIVAAAMVGTLEAMVLLLEQLGRRRFRALLLKVKAAIRRQMGKAKKERKQRFSFHYDPSSYALNFDDGVPALLLSSP